MTDVSEAAEAAWVALVRAHRVATARVEADLKAAGLPPLAWYDALWELTRAPAGLRPGALEARLLLAQYNVSRLLDRLEAAGLVEKSADPEDARARIVRLTAAGRRMREAMWPVYAAAIEAAVGARLSGRQARTLAALLRRLAAGDDEPDGRPA